MKRDVTARYQNAEHLLHDLEEFTRENGLWATPKAIGKYMRSLFADKINAWEAAEREGVTLGQHVQLTITNQSNRSHQSGTPSSAILVPSSTSAPLPVPSALTAPIPTVKPSRRGLVITCVAMLTLAGVGGGYYVVNQRDEAPPPAAQVTPVVAPTREPAVVPAPVEAPAAAPVA